MMVLYPTSAPDVEAALPLPVHYGNQLRHFYSVTLRLDTGNTHLLFASVARKPT
jgi:hypothetical protein